MLIEIVLGIAIAAAVDTACEIAKEIVKNIVSYIKEIIARNNLKELSEDALRNSNDADLKALLTKQIQICVEKKQGNTVSLKVLEGAGSTVKATIELTGTAVAEDVYVGLKV